MSSPPDNTATPHSVFLSYASADRVAARALRDTLLRAGLDVWLDEEELAGGEAWDAKIRQQIRTCTYVMPVISATTEARREGYFRREWRLAVERTLDLADDVLFLTPVAIDDTPEQGARVPEKFNSVQWLRCPGGRETPALVDLARRLAAGDTVASPRVPPRAPRGLRRTDRPAAATKDAPLPPLPPLPPFPEPGHRLRFVYDFVLWTGRTLYGLWRRTPRWIRWLLLMFLFFRAIGWFGSHDAPDNSPPAPGGAPVDVGKLLSDPDRLTGQKFLKAAGVALDALQGNRPVALVAFHVADPVLQEAATRSFVALHREVAGDEHAAQIAVSIDPLPASADDLASLVRATALKCHWLLAGAVRPADAGKFTLELKLYDATAGRLAWRGDRTGEIADADTVGEALGREVREHVTFDPAPAK
jgi:hypothetical protein